MFGLPPGGPGRQPGAQQAMRQQVLSRAAQLAPQFAGAAADPQVAQFMQGALTTGRLPGATPAAMAIVRDSAAFTSIPCGIAVTCILTCLKLGNCCKDEPKPKTNGFGTGKWLQ